MCFWTRRRFYTENLQEFLDLKKSDPQIEGAFSERRRAKAQGGDKYDQEARVSAKHTTSEQRTQFMETFEEGGCYHVKRWAKKRGVDTKGSDEDVAKRLRKEVPDIEIEHRNGKLVVLVVGDTKASDFNVRRGVQEARCRTITQEHLTAEEADLEEEGEEEQPERKS